MSGTPSPLQAARAALDEARQRLDDALQLSYPVGSSIRWRRQGGVRSGRVAMHGYFDHRIEVENEATGASYWITAWDISE